MADHLLLYALSAVLVLGTMALVAGLALLAARSATVTWQRVMGRGIAVVAAGLGLILPLLMLTTAPPYEESETNIIQYARVSCGSFPDRRAAQAFYDAVQDLDYKYEYFDRDRDGIACEPDDYEYHPRGEVVIPFETPTPVIADSLMPKPTPDFGYVRPAATPTVP